MNENNNFSLKKIDIQEKKNNSNQSDFTLTYFPIGLATTVGNSLRRILLSLSSGWAIFALKINNINNEFTTVSGISNLPTYLILNLKKLAFQAEEGKQNEVQVCQISIDNSQNKNEYQVTGKDIQGNLKIINPEVILTTVSQGAKLEITLYCRYSWGYCSAKEQKNLLPKEENVIFLSSDYCPVKEVSSNPVPVVISLDEQKETLVLGITTNGSISPSRALTESLKIWKNVATFLLESQKK